MTDNKMIIEQVNEILLIVNHLKDANIELFESFIVGVIIARLPSSWTITRRN